MVSLLSVAMLMEPVENLHERAFVESFVAKERRKRWLELLSRPKHRRKLTDSLAHPHPAWFQSKFVRPIAPAQSSAAGILRLLQDKGAGRVCWVISEDPKMDAREMDITLLIPDVVGYGMGVIVSCLPGRLAFVESEEGRFLLEK